jgi:hypothetical protein
LQVVFDIKNILGDNMYIDPNSGGMLFQILAVLFGVFSAVILLFSSKIRIAFAKLRRKIRERNQPETVNVISEDETTPPAS